MWPLWVDGTPVAWQLESRRRRAAGTVRPRVGMRPKERRVSGLRGNVRRVQT